MLRTNKQTEPKTYFLVSGLYLSGFPSVFQHMLNVSLTVTLADSVGRRG